MTPLAACRRVITRARLWTPMWTVLALVAGALVVTSLADPPDRVVAQEIDGRTWLSVPRGTDTALVLANGVSGLVEAEADLADAVPDDLRFGGSDGRFTVLASNGAAVVVADGTHAATVVELDEDAASVLGGGGLLTASTDVSVRTIAADGTIGEPAVVGDTGTPVAGVAPVVDGDGDTWVLTDDDRAARITTDGSVGDRVDVDSSATELLVVDGRAYARSDEALVELGGDRRRPGAGARGVVPSVATETDGRWAVASGRQITLDDDPDDIVSAPDDVRSLAVWFGHVWSATDGVAFAVDDGSVQPVDGVDGPFQLFADGGRLWFVGADGAIAIDRDQHATVFRLAGVDLSLCAGDCSPEAAVDFLDEITTTTAPRNDDDVTTTAAATGHHAASRRARRPRPRRRSRRRHRRRTSRRRRRRRRPRRSLRRRHRSPCLPPPWWRRRSPSRRRCRPHCRRRSHPSRRSPSHSIRPTRRDPHRRGHRPRRRPFRRRPPAVAASSSPSPTAVGR